MKPFADIFLEEYAIELSPYIGCDYAINIELDKDPLYWLLYCLSPKELKVL